MPQIGTMVAATTVTAIATAANEEAPPMVPHVAREHGEKYGKEAPPGVIPRMSPEDVAAVETVLGYKFGDKSLVGQALTPGSFYNPYRPGETYERLEYHGDGILNCLMSREVFRTYHTLLPGPHTSLRASNIEKDKLALVAAVHGLDRFLWHNAPRHPEQINTFREEMGMYPTHSNGPLDPPKVLSDIVESLVGAIYLDSNFNQEEAWQVFRNLVDPFISLETLGKHPMSELYELCQKSHRNVKIVKDKWEKNSKVEAYIDGELFGSATYAQKKEIAQNCAAKAALDKLKQTLAQCQTESVSADISEALDRLDLSGTL